MKFRNKALLLSVIALSGAGLGVSKLTMAQESGGVIKPTSSWAVTKVSQGKSDPYCTLVRQYEGGTILTLGQNLDEEYSIAIDFQKPKFDPEKPYPLTLQPGPGQLRAYEMIPASPAAMVVRLGWDDSFLAALADSQVLKVDIDKEEYSFGFPDFATGEKDLAACMTALKNPDAPVLASTNPEEKKPVFTAKKVEAKKAEMAEAKPVEEVKPVVAKKKAEPVKVMSPKVAAPDPAVVKAPVKSPVVKADTKELNKMASALSAAQQEKAKLKEALNKERLLRENLTREKQEYETLKKKDSEQSAAVQASQKQMTEKMDALTKQAAALSVENEKLKKVIAEKEKLALVSQEQNKASAEGEAEVKKMRSDLATALEERDSLLAELAEAKTKLLEKDVPTPAVTEEVAVLKKELADAKEQLVEKIQIISDVTQQKNREKESEKALVEKMAALEKRAQELEKENKRFYEDAKLARSQADNTKIELGHQTLQKVKKLEDKLEAAMADNISLSKQVEELSRMQDEVSVGLADGDWNLEKATRRYNEAEKEVRRLGALLEQQRGSFRSEARELEEMLFDPAVADKAQRKRLAELEMELAEANRKLARQGIATQERVMNRPDSRPSIAAPMPRAPAEPVERVSSAAVVEKVKTPRISPKPVVKAPVTAPKVSVSSFGQSDIQKIIASSRIGAGTVTSAGGNTYRWNTQNVSGFAQVVPKSQAGDVVQFAQNYITKQRARCQGDFASVPGDVGGGKTTYEIACVGGNASTSSSLIFFEKQGDVAMISHQASADDMDAAMDARDKVASQIR